MADISILFFGSSIDVWAAIISVFILSLSVGYWAGGRLADKMASNKALGVIIVLSGIWYLLLPTFARPFIDMLSSGIAEHRWGSLVPCLFLFLPPSLLLGCVSPMLVRLVFISGEQVGRTTGTLYAIGSFGNVLGILVTNYFLLAAFTLNGNCYGMGVALCLCGLGHLLIPIDAQQADTSSSAQQADSATMDTADGIMSRLFILALLASVIAAIIGASLSDDPYRLLSTGLPNDQLAVMHRDSPYSHVTWVASEGTNYAELRFFDKVEGGVCLRPRWDELPASSSLKQPADYVIPTVPKSSYWAEDQDLPNPGSLAHTRYVNLYHPGILLNQDLMARANNDPRQAPANILIIGLGSGVGASSSPIIIPKQALPFWTSTKSSLIWFVNIIRCLVGLKGTIYLMTSARALAMAVGEWNLSRKTHDNLFVRPHLVAMT